MSSGFIPKRFRWIVLILIAAFMIQDYATGHWIFGTIELCLGIFLGIAYSLDKE